MAVFILQGLTRQLYNLIIHESFHSKYFNVGWSLFNIYSLHDKDIHNHIMLSGCHELSGESD